MRPWALKKKKERLLVQIKIPPEGLPGSLAETSRRCGKKYCHCAQGEGHPIWYLTFMMDRKKRVERIPEELVDSVRQRVEQGREFKEAVTEIFNANAELLVLFRKAQKI